MVMGRTGEAEGGQHMRRAEQAAYPNGGAYPAPDTSLGAPVKPITFVDDIHGRLLAITKRLSGLSLVLFEANNRMFGPPPKDNHPGGEGDPLAGDVHASERIQRDLIMISRMIDRLDNEASRMSQIV